MWQKALLAILLKSVPIAPPPPPPQKKNPPLSERPKDHLPIDLFITSALRQNAHEGSTS
jgi:hypothetical protein